MSEDREATTAFVEALRRGGIEFVTAFPGSPTTVLAQRLEREGSGVEFRWAVNENVALSQAFGAAMGGRGAAVLMKHVGINVAADALQAMGVVHGLPAPLLLIEGADAKPGSSQSAQDNRSLYAGSPQLLVLAPSTPAEIDAQVRAACAISRAAGMIVVIRGDARCFAGRGPVDADADERPALASAAPRFSPWPERGRSLATAARTYAAHLEDRARALARLEPWIAALHVDWGLDGEDTLELAVVVAGHLGAEIGDAARAHGLPGMRLLCEHPLPTAALLALAGRCRSLLVLEECAPSLEQQIAALVQRGLAPASQPRVLGRSAFGDRRPIGRLGGDALATVLAAAAAHVSVPTPTERAPTLFDPTACFVGWVEEQLAADEALDRAHPPAGFPTSDPRKALFAALRSLRDRGGAGPVFIAADPGITGVLALADHGCDVKMHMGGAVAMAAGWSRARPEGLAVAVVGDTNLPHSEWLGLIDALDHGDDVLVVIADNGASEMTQRIVTPRLAAPQAQASLRAAGLPCLEAQASTDPTDPWAQTLKEAAAHSGPRLLWLTL